MGGPVPLGYNLEARKLIPNPTEAGLVRNIFALYLKLGCVWKLMAQLNRENVKTKTWVTKTGARLGGVSFGRGHLYCLLRNRLYIGEIRHRDRWYPGEHPGIVPRDLWEKVQAQLNGNLRTHRNRARDQASSLLTGLIEDAEGNRFTPSFTIKRGRRYRYYVSQDATKNSAGECEKPTRLPAHEVERRVTERLQGFLKSDGEIFDGLSLTGDRPAVLKPLVAAAQRLAAKLPSLPSDDLRDLLACFLQRVIIRENDIQVMIRRNDLRQLLECGDHVIAANLVRLRKPTEPDELICLTIEARRKQYGGEVHLVVAPNSSVPVRHPRPALIKAVVRGRAWYEKLLDGKIVDIKSRGNPGGTSTAYSKVRESL